MIHRMLDLFFGRMLRQDTTRYLDELASAPIRTSQQQMEALLNALAATGQPVVTLGTTNWGQSVAVPISEILCSHALITGGSGSGKTFFALLILQALIDQLPQNQSVGFGVLDPKNDLFAGALFLLAKRLSVLDLSDPESAAALRRRIVIVDFAASDPVSSYNILSRRAGMDQKMSMSIIGHKTPAISNQYNILVADDVTDEKKRHWRPVQALKE